MSHLILSQAGFDHYLAMYIKNNNRPDTFAKQVDGYIAFWFEKNDPFLFQVIIEKKDDDCGCVQTTLDDLMQVFRYDLELMFKMMAQCGRKKEQEGVKPYHCPIGRSPLKNRIPTNVTGEDKIVNCLKP
jgi:hypothetical protein